MDPLSHAVTGSLLAQSFARRPEIRAAALLGALAGMAPDLDIFIRSENDPLLQIQYHRHFSHALLFAPIGALLCALIARLGQMILAPLAPGRPFQPQDHKGNDPRKPGNHTRLSFSRLYLFCFLGYVQGGLLDACTSYGTHLWWPLSQTRVAWSNIAIIDPLYTLPLLALAIAAALRRSPRVAWAGLVWMAFYLSLGLIQKNRAEAYGYLMAREQDAVILRLEAKPAIFSNRLFRVISQTEDTYRVDAVFVPWFGQPRLFEGGTVPVPTDYFIAIPPEHPRRHDLERFAYFSDQWVYFVNDDDNVIGDFRYAMLPNSTEPLWTLQLSRDDPEVPITFQTHRKTDLETRQQLMNMLRGIPPGSD